VIVPVSEVALSTPLSTDVPNPAAFVAVAALVSIVPMSVESVAKALIVSPALGFVTVSIVILA